MNWLEKKVPPPVLGLLLAGAMWWLSRYEPRLAIRAAPRENLAIIVAAAGILCDLAGLIGFLAARTTVNPLAPQKTTSLVTDGVYRLSRNPMYLGMALLLAGWAIHLGSLWSVLGVPAFMLYITRFQILPEERVLAAKFGETFEAYARRTRRWF